MYDRADLVELLRARGSEQAELFSSAREARTGAGADGVIVRGVVEVTNICRVDCEYCPMRRANQKQLNRYTLDGEGLLGASQAIRDCGLDVVFFQAGETPRTTRLVGEAIPAIRQLFGQSVEILLCLGSKSRSDLEYLKGQGATSYILKHETSDALLHESMRHETLESRLTCLRDLLTLGYRVGTGTIVGLPGQTLDSIADDILLAKELGVHMCSASPFVPAPGTPLEEATPGDVDTTLNAIAAMRLVHPPWLIPSVSALEQTHEDGQLRGLEAGANVLTINFTPRDARSSYLIYGSQRFLVSLEHVRRTLGRASLRQRGSCFVGDERPEDAGGKPSRAHPTPEF